VVGVVVGDEYGRHGATSGFMVIRDRGWIVLAGLFGTPGDGAEAFSALGAK
jgi:hypothetical protein